ncbi:tyrosine-type recombinase/integrase [Jannaschia sp. R86511]|uniref:tyrosine-type recombinase/integrase n=1 Tax=Jannaschia sp. R86511 TaxID=3093853 RepID=UPI0036D2254C
MGSVSRRKNGRWRARYRDPSGKQRSRDFTRKIDAQRWLASMDVAMGRGEWLDPALGNITLGEWSRSWLTRQSQLKPSTALRYEGLLENQVLPTWRDIRLSDIAHSAVADWVAGLSRAGLSPSSVRHAHRVLSLMLSSAVRDGRLPRNVAAGVRLPRVGVSEKRFLSHGQIRELAAAVGEPFDAVVLVLAFTGLRWGELAALRVRDVDLERRRVHVARSMTEIRGRAVFGTPKNHQRRSVPLPAFLVEPLRPRVAGRTPDDLAFTSRAGAVLRNRNFRTQVFDRAAREVGLDGLTPHELRHTAASLAIAAGANVKAVQRMLGHASAAMTLDVYAGLFADDLDEVARVLHVAYTTGEARLRPNPASVASRPPQPQGL